MMAPESAPTTVRRRARSVIGVGVAVSAAALMISTGSGVAISAPTVHSSLASTPTLAVTISKKHFTVHGPKTFQAGRVDIALTAVGGERTVEVGSLKKGYTFADVRKDLTAFGKKAGTGPNGSTPKGAIKHLDRVVHRTNLYGGLDAQKGQTLRGSVVLAKPGTYIIFNDANLPSDPHKLTVTGPEAKRASPKSSATVTALTTRRFGGAKILPAKGTITFKNRSTESPHMLQLIHVKTGTTKKEVLTALESSGGGAPPSFVLKGEAATDSIGEGFSQTLTYRLPKGEYVELCFFPDPKTGMPHAFMGMIGVVTLK
jgi:hypothetical protein